MGRLNQNGAFVSFLDIYKGSQAELHKLLGSTSLTEL